MAARKSEVAARFQLRRGLSVEEAAIYIGLGRTKFNEMVKDGRMPRPRLIDNRRVWDVDEIDAAFRSLPIEGEAEEVENPWH